jgi:hypothetical protein
MGHNVAEVRRSLATDGPEEVQNTHREEEVSRCRSHIAAILSEAIKSSPVALCRWKT